MSRIIPDGKGGFILEVSPASDPNRVIPHGRSGEGNKGPAATALSGQKADPPARGQPALMQDPQMGPSREGQFKEERQLQSGADLTRPSCRVRTIETRPNSSSRRAPPRSSRRVLGACASKVMPSSSAQLTTLR
ncbi:hypothetical protein Ddc_16040 [Ditylenchus destructor]|nr:hypothetical protein Ddc_16040 [Ditylenchus destructor]